MFDIIFGGGGGEVTPFLRLPTAMASSYYYSTPGYIINQLSDFFDASFASSQVVVPLLSVKWVS